MAAKNIYKKNNNRKGIHFCRDVSFFSLRREIEIFFLIKTITITISRNQSGY